MAALTPEACRAARALLKWGVRDLAEKADLSPTTVAMVEGGKPHASDTAAAIVAAFAAAGVEITNGDGTGARLLLKKAKTAKRKAGK